MNFLFYMQNIVHVGATPIADFKCLYMHKQILFTNMRNSLLF